MNENTIIHVVPDKVQGEVSALYSVPGTHVLFIGPRECARHNCRMHYRLGRISWLCPTDTELAMGRLESMVPESVESLIERYKQEQKELFGVILYTGCQTEFLNVDFDYLLRMIRKRFHIAAAHHSISRFQRFDRMRPAERDIFGDVFRLLEPVDADVAQSEAVPSSGGLQVLSRPVPMDQTNDFRVIAESAGMGWSRNTGEWHSAEDFLRSRESTLNIVTAEERLPAARYLQSAFGIPWIVLKDSRRLTVVDKNYRMLQEKLGEMPETMDIAEASEKMRKEAVRRIEATRETAGDRVLTLDLQQSSRPWDVTRALIEYGFRIGKIVLRSFPAPPGLKPPRGIQPPPGMRKTRQDTEDNTWVKKNAPNLEVEEKRPDFRRMMRGGACIHDLPEYLKKTEDTAPKPEGFPPVQPGPGGGVSEAAYWGYSGICMLMEQICKSLDGQQRI